MNKRTPSKLELTIGWTFADPGLLATALTHSTFANENPDLGADNERLEFLGDAVLDLIAARLLFERPGDAREGEMSRRRARVVRLDTLASLAEELGLGEFIRLGQGQAKSGGTPGILADTYEALVGAVFLDGGYDAAERCFAESLTAAITRSNDRVDFKTHLQELCHEKGFPPPRYEVVAVDGPDHARVYRCQVRIGKEIMGKGNASSKKRAEQSCAEEAVEKLNCS